MVSSFVWTQPERDGRTDRQNWSSYYSALHCEQCGRAVETVLLTAWPRGTHIWTLYEMP